jgi:lipopolysaccharide transport system permease protein
MQQFGASPRALASSLWANRALLRTLVAREVLGRYRGSMLGVLWSFLNPIFMLAVYTFVFGVVFNARWTAGTGSRSEFALALFVGLIAFNLFAECVNRAPSVVLANANYVKKVVFPLEILPLVGLGAAGFHSLVSLLVWVVFHFVAIGVPPSTVAWVPLIALPLLLVIMGLSWGLASLGVYLRDVAQITGLLTTALMFLSPVFYPAASLPPALQAVFHLNPLTPVIEMLRDALMWGRPPSPATLGSSLALGVAVSWLGFAWFQKTRKGFADVL